jgi:hypothetical protein
MSRLAWCLVVLVTGFSSSAARAQEDASTAPPPRVAAGPALTPAERSRLENITALPPERLELLLADPRLHDLASKAIEAHAHRKLVGAVTTISGVALTGAGLATSVFTLILAMTCWSGDRDCSHYDMYEKGGLVVAAVGVPIFLYGLVRLNWSTSEEDELLRALAAWRVEARLPPQRDMRAPAKRALTIPLLALEL